MHKCQIINGAKPFGRCSDLLLEQYRMVKERVKDNQRLLAEVKLLKENLKEQHQELLERIDSSLAMREGQISKSDGESTITEQAIDDSASAMLSSFGVEF